LLTHRQTNKQTNKVWQKHNHLGGGKYTKVVIYFGKTPENKVSDIHLQ